MYTSIPSAATPYLSRFIDAEAQFNDTEVDARKGRTVMDILAEYDIIHAQVMSLITWMPEEVLRQTETLPWYGVQYALDDFIVYAFYVGINVDTAGRLPSSVAGYNLVKRESI